MSVEPGYLFQFDRSFCYTLSLSTLSPRRGWAPVRTLSSHQSRKSGRGGVRHTGDLAGLALRHRVRERPQKGGSGNVNFWGTARYVVRNVLMGTHRSWC